MVAGGGILFLNSVSWVGGVGKAIVLCPFGANSQKPKCLSWAGILCIRVRICQLGTERELGMGRTEKVMKKGERG